MAVAAAFELSYQDLPPGRQRLFRRLGLHPGTELDAYAAAALDGSGLADARYGLEALYGDHLLIESAQGRSSSTTCCVCTLARSPAPTCPPTSTLPLAGCSSPNLHTATIADQLLTPGAAPRAAAQSRRRRSCRPSCRRCPAGRRPWPGWRPNVPT